MKEYKIPASIILAQAIEESANGNSDLARNANNHFGVKCQDRWSGETYYKDDETKHECFRKYKSVEESYRDHCEFIRTRNRYSFLFDLKTTDYHGWARGLKSAGYATNPTYAEKLIYAVEKYNLNQYDIDVANPQLANIKTDKTSQNDFNYSHKRTTNEERRTTFYKQNRELSVINGIKVVVAKKGDNIDILAKDLDMFKRQIMKYNDLNKADSIHQGDIIYLQPKKEKQKPIFISVSMVKL